MLDLDGGTRSDWARACRRRTAVVCDTAPAAYGQCGLSAVRDDTGRLTHYIGYQVDVSERVERERQLHQLAYYDAGSGLPNLAHAMLHLESLIAEAAAIDVVYIGLPATPSFQRTATDPDLSLTTVLARRLRAALNDNAMVAKLDGDAFLVIQPGPEPDLMDQVPAAIGEHIIAPAGTGRLAIRIGRAGYPDDGVSATELIALAQGNAG